MKKELKKINWSQLRWYMKLAIIYGVVGAYIWGVSLCVVFIRFLLRG